MKKVFFAVLMLCCGILYAQEYTVIKGTLSTIQPTFYSNLLYLNGFNDQKIIYSEDYFSPSQKNIDGDVIFYVDAENNSVAECEVDHNEDYRLQAAFENAEEVFGLYEYFNAKQKKYGLYLNAVAKNATKGDWNPQELVLVTTEKRDGRYVFTATSPDKNMFAVALLGADRSGSMQGSVLMIFDSNGQLVRESKIPLSFVNKTFNLLDMVMNNEGEVYCAICSYNQQGKSKSNMEFNILAMTERGDEMVEQSVTFGEISNGKLLFTRDGNLALAGYYSEANDNFESGTYCLTYDVHTQTVNALSNKDFPKSYYEKGAMFKAYANYVVNQRCEVLPRGIYEFEDGTIGLIGEQKGVISVVSQTGTTYFVVAKNIMYNSITSDGVQDLTLISKNQQRSAHPSCKLHSIFLSYYPFFANNTIYLVYNDNEANYLGKSNQPFNYALNRKKAALVMRTIEADGRTDAKVIARTAVTKNFVEHVPFMIDDGFIVIDGQKKGSGISKVSVNF